MNVRQLGKKYMKQASKPIRIVIDTNLFISLLIGKRSVELREILVSPLFTIVVSQSLIEEIRKVANRPKFSRYFNLIEVEAFLEFLRGISDTVELKEIPARCRDPKDDYLLELAMASKAEFLLTGDDDLLEMKRVGFCRILTVRDFLLLLQSQK